MYIKYPRTYHLPWSEGATSDDKIHKDTTFFEGKDVVVTEKRDGENSTIYSNGYFHARSMDGNSHPSQAWLKNFIQGWYFDIPKEWRVCGENLYALHSLYYDSLISYFEVFSIWNEKNECLSWKETEEWCKLLKLKTVPILYEGIYDETFIRNIKLDTDVQEGYVVRISNSFSYSQFNYSVAKFVRKNHVTTSSHWRRGWLKDKINKLVVL